MFGGERNKKYKWMWPDRYTFIFSSGYDHAESWTGIGQGSHTDRLTINKHLESPDPVLMTLTTDPEHSSSDGDHISWKTKSEVFIGMPKLKKSAKNFLGSIFWEAEIYYCWKKNWDILSFMTDLFLSFRVEEKLFLSRNSNDWQNKSTHFTVFSNYLADVNGYF